MDKKYKTENDEGWIPVEKESRSSSSYVPKKEFLVSTDDSDSFSGRPKTLDEIQRNVRFPHIDKENSDETDSPDVNEKAAAEKFYAPPRKNHRPVPRVKSHPKKNKKTDKVVREPENIDEKGTAPEPQFAKNEDTKSTSDIKLKRALFSVGHFFRRHKVFTIIIAVIIVFVSSLLITVNHFLNKINYVETEDYTTVESAPKKEKKLKYITLSTGEIIDVTNLVKNADGTYNLPDGRRFNKDRTIWNVDGSIVFYDGSYMLPDGTAVLSNGTTFYPNELLVYQSGSFHDKCGYKVSKDGYVSFFNGVIAHLTNFLCAESGLCTSKTSSISNLKHRVTGSWNAYKTEKVETKVQVDSNNDADDEEEKISKALSNAEGLNDDEIAQNYNNNEIWYNDDIKNILLMGIDEGSKSYPYGRSDSMIVLSINKKTKSVKMVSFARAVYVAIAGYDNTRLNHAHGYGGAPLAIDTIERNYKIRIDNYVETGFETFKQIIDVLGGVQINLTKAEASALKSKLKKSGYKYNGAGKYNLNGKMALEYVRLRKIDTDKERTARQRKVLLSIANKVKNSNILQLTNLANQILPLITTDMSKSEIISQLTTLNSYLNGKVEQYVVPHKSSALTLIGEYEVLILDWKDEVKYVHQLFYKDVVPSYYSK